MDAAQALADLTEISLADRGGALLDQDGGLLGRAREPRGPREVLAVRCGASRRGRRLSERTGPRDPARGLDSRGASSRAGDGTPDRRDAPARADGRADLLRPQALPPRAPPSREAEAARREGRDEAQLSAVGFATGSSPAGPLTVALRRARIERVELYADDGSMVSFHRRLARGGAAAAARARACPSRESAAGDDADLAAAIRERRCSRATSSSAPASAALLPRQVPLRDPPRPAAPRSASDRGAVREHEPDAVRLAAPELGAVPLAAAASLDSGLPFLIVRNEAKEYGTANRLEGAFEEGELRLPRRGRRDVGRRAPRGGRGAPRGRSRRPTAVCVVDREEGGADALARAAVRLRPLFRAGDLLQGQKTPANRMVEPQIRPC